MKKTLLLIVCMLGNIMLHAQDWTAPQIPAEDLNTLESTELVYFYNVEADAFVLNGMDWNTNACATRLTNGDHSISIPQQCYAFITDGNVSVRLKNYGDKYISCSSENAYDVYVDQTNNYQFKYTETESGSLCYTLTNTQFGKDLDVVWDNGGHLTLVEGAGHTTWAFISQTSVTNGDYSLYKFRKRLYDLYITIKNNGIAEKYADALTTAHAVYTAEDATEASLTEASRTLFTATYLDIKTVTDVSFLFDNTDMVNAGNCKGWTTLTPAFGWGEFEVWHANINLTQTQTIPQGLYDVTMRSFYRQDGTDAAPTLTAKASNTVVVEIPLIGSLNYLVGNANSNNWTSGEMFNQPNGMQSGAQALAHNDIVARAENVIVDETGSLTITAKMASTSQWFNWQEISIYYKGQGTQSLKDELSAVIAEATDLYGDGSGKGAAALKSVLDKANGIYNDSDAAGVDIIAVTEELTAAMETYRYDSASLENPIDFSEYILNRSFEKGFDEWTQSGLSLQSNNAFSLKVGSAYVEKWTGAGGSVGDAHVEQRVKNLKPAVYIVKVAAQNIQEGSTAKQKNAWLFANNSKTEVTDRADYSLIVTSIEQELSIGFLAKGATGNWIGADNFRLYYAGGELADFTEELNKYIELAEVPLSEKMEKSVRNNITSAIADAKAVLGNPTTDGILATSTPVREAMEAAYVSIDAFKALAAAIEKAESEYGNGSLLGADKFLAAINQAKSVNDNLESTQAQMAQEIVNLEKAAFAYLLDNGSGTAPTVKTDPRYARGAIAAFGRMSVSGVASADILEQGFCWSTEPDPTVLDYRSTNYLENNGRIYVMNMEPATVYYIRAYAMTKTYAVGYGDIIKMSTLPMGNVTYWYNNFVYASQNNRINTALSEACYYWTNYTSIRGFNVSCTYSPGTPTADCGYGGNMRMGTNMGQRTGTCMHEMSHGIGTGTITIWGGEQTSPLRTSINGDWAGERANEVVRFWENREDIVLTAAYDDAHWGLRYLNGTYSQDDIYLNKYPINGAHLEPYAWAGPQDWNGTQILFIGNSLIHQGFCEDGLVPVNYWSGGFCLPAYVFEQDDEKKYYIKNEDASHGLYNAYLTETSTRQIVWSETSGGTPSDSAAWYVSFNPQTQYYQFRNAATGHYLSYSNDGTNGIKAAARTTLTNNESFHLMKGRNDVEVGTGTSKQTLRGFWMIHPEQKNNPATLTAQANGKTAAITLNLYDSSTTQRWIFLEAEETTEFDEACTSEVIADLRSLIRQIRRLQNVEHTEDVADADTTLTQELASLEAAIPNITTTAEAQNFVETARTLAATYLSSVTPTNLEKPFDITFMINNAKIDDNSGWSDAATFSNSCCEYFQSTFHINQTLSHLPHGTYKHQAQAFQRPGDYATVYSLYQNGTSRVNTVLYAGDDYTKICNIAEEARTYKLSDEDAEVTNPKAFIPNTMASAAAYFKRRLYQNEVYTTTTQVDGTMKIGIKCNTSVSGNWVIFDNFRLYFYGSTDRDIITGIETIEPDTTVPDRHFPAGVYNLQGIKVGDTLDGLPRGIYIMNGKKVMK